MTLAQRRPNAPAVDVRDATDADMDAVAAIYAHHVRTGLATFEETPLNTLFHAGRFCMQSGLAKHAG